MTQGTLKDKVAVVTGAGRGIGRAVAIGLGGEGAWVSCASRTKSEIEATASAVDGAGGRGQAVTTDVTDLNGVRNMYRETVEAFGGIDILYINAGGNLEKNSVEESDPALWVGTLELNLVGAFYCSREAIPFMEKRGGGKIITIGSGMGHHGLKGNSSYCCSKAGLWMFTRILAQELVDENISVNELIPGPVETSLTRSAVRSQRGVFGISGEWVKQPEDVVPLALFLARQPLTGPTAQSFSLMRRDN